jgi:hypothetical protein
MLQTIMTDVLDLEFQLRGIDYQRANMVHADMSPEQFAETMRKRGETMLGTLIRTMGYAMAQQSRDPSGSGDLKLLTALFDKDRATALKRVLAEQFEDLEGALGALSGPDGSTLISERNKVALEVLREQIATGKRRIAIFYGAGHMSDMRLRLRDDFRLVPRETRWIAAWDLRSKPTSRDAP